MIASINKNNNEDVELEAAADAARRGTSSSSSSSNSSNKINMTKAVVTAFVLCVACIATAVVVVAASSRSGAATTTGRRAGHSAVIKESTSHQRMLWENVTSSFLIVEPLVEEVENATAVENATIATPPAIDEAAVAVATAAADVVDAITAVATAEPTSSIIVSEVSIMATTSSPSSRPTTKSPTAKPSTAKPTTKQPTSKPSTKMPTKKPVTPTRQPTPLPTMAPTIIKPFVRGDLAITVASLGIKICTGMSVKLIAKSGQKVTYANGSTSSITFHKVPDGAGIIPVASTGGYVYVSNSEGGSGSGGVYGIYFDSAGKVTNYVKYLGGTTWNCGGGKTPWDTWVSCEEHSLGQCWQIDPNPSNMKATKTLVGGAGGYYESFAVDNRIPTKPVVFVTEDASNGALRKYTPPASSTSAGGNFNALHTSGGTYEYLVFLNSTHFKWSTSLSEGRTSQQKYYAYSEGIDFHNGFLYFVSKTLYKMFVLNLDTKTYTTMSTQFGSLGTGGGAFNHQPDQIVRNGGDYLYLTEDGGVSPGIYALHKPTGAKYAIVQGYSSALQYDETAGLAFSPDGRKMYTAFQDCGCLLEFSRDDGKSFDGDTLDVKFHSPTQVFRRGLKDMEQR